MGLLALRRLQGMAVGQPVAVGVVGVGEVIDLRRPRPSTQGHDPAKPVQARVLVPRIAVGFGRQLDVAQVNPRLWVPTRNHCAYQKKDNKSIKI